MSGTNANGRFVHAVTAVVALFWAGMVAGVSFLATPVKFQAPSLSLPVALEVGRVTFGAFSIVEWILAAILAIAVFFRRLSRAGIAITILAIATLAFESLWLLPVLDARVEAVIAGNPRPPSWHHMAYAAAEVVKFAALFAIAIDALHRLGWMRRENSREG